MDIKLHIYSANDDGYTFHHTSNLSFNDKSNAMQGALDAIMALHEVLDHDVQMFSMENKDMTIEDKDVTGVMITSAGLPYSCFIGEVTIDTDGTYVYDPDMPTETIMEVPKC